MFDSTPSAKKEMREDNQEVQALILQRLCAYTMTTCLANFGFAGVSVVVAWAHCNHVYAMVWMMGATLANFGRCQVAKRWKRKSSAFSDQTWLRLHVLFAGLSGLSWGIGAWVLLSPDDLPTRAFYLFIVAGLASGAATTSSVHRPTFFAYIASSGIFLALRMLSFPGGLDLLLGCVSVFGVALYLRVGLLNHRLFMESFALRLSNSRLITRLEDAHVELESTNASLEQRVAERTNSLECEIQARYEAERQLRRAHRMEAVGRLTGGIAHDFNNVLTVILHCLEMVKHRDEEDEVMISHAKSAASRGAALTQQLLSFSRKSSSLPEVVELNAVLEQIIESMLKPVLRGSIRVEFFRSETPVHVQVQRSELDTALLNLVLNARDSMPEGGTVRIVNRIHGGEVTVEVQDQGTGIDPQDIERVFEPCFSTKGEDGTGLGLSMVRGFALRSSGDIRVESSARGTTFYLTLPTCTAPLKTSAEVPRSTRAKARRRARVLVVEDNPDLLRSTVRVVQELGYKTECAQDATQALRVLERESMDILLSDIRMPGEHSGLELARIVVRRWPGVQILLVTGHAPELCDSAEIRVLRKPYAVRQLSKALHEAASEPWPKSDAQAPRF